MNEGKQPIRDEDLHAFVDGQLDSARRTEVEAWLAENPRDAERVEAYRKQNLALHALFDPALSEPVPATMRRAEEKRGFHGTGRYAAAAAFLALGTVIGWVLHGLTANVAPPTLLAALPQQAAIAHAVYAPEVLHPVEVSAEQETHLVNWLSKRLGRPMRVPHLATIGYDLVGGRLLPGEQGPAAQFMYQDARGKRLTLYVRVNTEHTGDTAFRYARHDAVSVFYWVDGPMGYALSGEIEKPALLDAAHTVYRELGL